MSTEPSSNMPASLAPDWKIVFKLLIEWENYIQQTPATDNAKLLQLIAACDGYVYDSGDFARMKELAAGRLHKGVQVHCSLLLCCTMVNGLMMALLFRNY